jgi:hypothetical protein
VLVAIVAASASLGVQALVDFLAAAEVLGTFEKVQIIPRQVFIDLAELGFVRTEGEDDGRNRAASESLESSETVTPRDEESRSRVTVIGFRSPSSRMLSTRTSMSPSRRILLPILVESIRMCCIWSACEGCCSIWLGWVAALLTVTVAI